MVLDNLDRIQLTLDYMEQNLKTEIQGKELSKMVGYSETYYSELFKKVTGIPIGQYLIRRTLAHAICEMKLRWNTALILMPVSTGLSAGNTDAVQPFT